MNKNTFFENEYMPRMHKIGKITGLCGVITSFLPAIVLAVVYGLLPKPAALLTASLSALSAFGLLWIFEPISYFSVLGPVGTYMAFLSGNISNMRVPCASMAQLSAGIEPGTEEGSIIATIGMAVSVVINISVLTIGVILGSSILKMLPPQVTESLNYLLPALFGALLIQFGAKAKNLAAGIFIFGVLMNIALLSGLFQWLPGSSNYLGILSCVFLSIAITLRKQTKQSKQN
ncbi:MAG: hypothetical protein Q4A78_09615 [Peptostreptococcaceae bacterium]|nr:hypothetical protein [Peptostreptococcaceae bacterium]